MPMNKIKMFTWIRILNRFFRIRIWNPQFIKFFWAKSTLIFSELAQIFFFTRSKIKIIFNFCDICGYKTSGTTIFPPPLLLDPGSGMDKSQDPKSGINIPDPQIIPDTNGMVPVSSDYNIIILGDAIFLQYSSGSTEMEKHNYISSR
jgi:hypothetical protein